ncbi:hypothetical protein CathTA2_1170 [Caldalkalibacillus thermarum TA2.A1]|uniref:Uncharacterized protein n=1 Tax=Caldalkalibacillus thermarum (strain TA2.A1) TaxID=986075 RepID=F5L5V7_CALTT|nr:hypothetical protein CathTA2_1170 [Caldalkalibacillus thermarum TA2.A1]
MERKQEPIYFNWHRDVTGWNRVVNGHEQGFFLLEVIIALSVFALVCFTVFPAWQVLQEKRFEQQQKSLAIDLAQNEMERFRAGLIDGGETKRTIVLQEHQFQVQWKIDRQTSLEEGKVEIEWHIMGGSGNKSKLEFVVYRNKRD